MGKILFYLSLLIIILSPISSMGAIKNIAVSWTMTDTSNVVGYKMYLSYDSMMTNQFFACETSNASTTTLTCSNIDLVQSPVYIRVVATTTGGEIYSNPIAQTFAEPVGTSPPSDSTVPVVQGFKVVVTPASTNPIYKINFQPSDVSIPTGYWADTGGAFNTSNGYGWVKGPSSLGPRDRDNSSSPDQAYDTMIHLNPNSIWELAVPNGNYSITICNGDPSFPVGNQNVQVEGQTIVNNVELSSTSPWVVETTSITVADGLLTFTFAGSSDPARLGWITVTPDN